MELSLRRFAAAPERDGLGGVEFLADSDVVSDVGVASGWLAASGLRDAHPEATVRTQTTKIIRSANLKAPIFRATGAAGSISELYR